MRSSLPLLRSAAVVVVIFGAVALSLARFGLSGIDGQRDQIADWIAQVVGRPVELGKIEGDWWGVNPRLSVSDLRLLDDSRASVILSFQRAAIEISLARSLFARELVPESLHFSGIELTLVRNEDGRISVGGMPPAETPMAGWLVNQRNFTVTDADVMFVDRRTGLPPARFAHTRFAVATAAGGTRIRLQTLPGSDLVEEIRADIEAEGNLLGTDWSGTVTVAARGASIAATLARFGIDDSVAPAGVASLRLTSEWSQARLRGSRFELAATALDWGRDAAAGYSEAALRGRLASREQGWDLDLYDIELRNGAVPQRRIETIALRGRQLAAGRVGVAAALAPIYLEDLVPVAAAVSPVDAKLRATLARIAPRGRINDFRGGVILGAAADSNEPRAEHRARRPVAFSARVEDVVTTGTEIFPALSGLAADIEVSPAGFSVAPIAGTRFQISSSARLEHAVTLEPRAGTVHWRGAGNRWQLYTSDLDVTVEGIEIGTRGIVSRDGGAAPRLNFVNRIGQGEAARLRALIPLGVMPEKGDRWSRKLFRSGRIERGGLVIRGPADRFPFKDGGGVLSGLLEVADAEIEYGRSWPPAHDVDAVITVEGERLRAELNSGKIFDADITGTTATMPDVTVRQRVALVSGKSSTTAAQPKRLILESPLRNTKAARVRDVEVEGAVDLTLDLALELYPGGSKDVLGQVLFKGVRIHSAAEALTLEDVHGTVSFTRDDWFGSGLEGLYDGHRVGLVVNGGLDDPNYDIEFRMTGRFGVDEAQKHLKKYTPSLYQWLDLRDQLQAFSGELPWKVVLTIPENESSPGASPRLLRIESSLEGMRSELPWPFGKVAGESKPMVITSRLGGSAAPNLTEVDFGDTLDAQFVTTRGDDGARRLSRAELVFGTEDPEFGSEPGIQVRGHIETLPSQEWLRLFRGGGVSDGETPVRIDLAVDRLLAFNRSFDDLSISGTRDGATGAVRFSSRQVSGTARLGTMDAGGKLLDVALDKLLIARTDDSAATVDLDPRTLPAIQLTCGSLQYGNVGFGEVTLTTQPDADGVVLESFESRHPSFGLNGSGHWRLNDGVHQSSFDLTVTAGSLADMLANFGYQAANVAGGATRLDIQASWGGMPSQFELEELEGILKLEIKGGRLLDVEPGGGRLFGLLSVQALPRRLLFDFDDLFRKGFKFDEISGTFLLENGNAYTNSLTMNGPAARIEIAGRTGLAEQDYDQHVTVTPDVSSSLPAAGALFGPPGIGVGAVLFLGQKIFKSTPLEMDRILSREYTITGPWTEPLIEKI